MENSVKILNEVIGKIKDYNKKYGINLDEFHNVLFVTSILLALLFIFYIIFILFAIFCKKSKTNKVVLLLGPCESGKTTFLFKLKTDKMCRTVPSMKENVAFVFLKNIKKSKFIQFVDFPGHPKLAFGIKKYLNVTNVIVYILDSSDRQSLKYVAENMLELFMNKEIVKRQIPIIIFCNKTDLCNSRPKKVIKEDLEREIEILKMSKYNSLEDDMNDETESFLGVNSEFFRFERAPIHVEICSASIKNNNVDEVIELIGKYY
ncbi:signal recognition particle, beta subunit, putative [Plasmodium chabaudi adami]|uniref:Signal recognition particle receptor subunit beta n=1 Tax=Plasmodium chabaudi adami TaxID=5826 RepID=A0A1C6YQV4_PLACE|nr:signal recognition particle, beta subunit, putative [Plasmodium chabaudi adami]